jgi:hypothetical protein
MPVFHGNDSVNSRRLYTSRLKSDRVLTHSDYGMPVFPRFTSDRILTHFDFGMPLFDGIESDNARRHSDLTDSDHGMPVLPCMATCEGGAMIDDIDSDVEESGWDGMPVPPRNDVRDVLAEDDLGATAVGTENDDVQGPVSDNAPSPKMTLAIFSAMLQGCASGSPFANSPSARPVCGSDQSQGESQQTRRGSTQDEIQFVADDTQESQRHADGQSKKGECLQLKLFGLIGEEVETADFIGSPKKAEHKAEETVRSRARTASRMTPTLSTASTMSPAVPPSPAMSPAMSPSVFAASMSPPQQPARPPRAVPPVMSPSLFAIAMPHPTMPPSPLSLGMSCVPMSPWSAAMHSPAMSAGMSPSLFAAAAAMSPPISPSMEHGMPPSMLAAPLSPGMLPQHGCPPMRASWTVPAEPEPYHGVHGDLMRAATFPVPVDSLPQRRRAGTGAEKATTVRGAGANGRRNDQVQRGPPTTICFRNLPNNYSTQMVLELLNSHGFHCLYDFVYVPHDFKRLPKRVNVGYFFVDFISHDFASSALEKLSGFRRWGVSSNKVLSGSWAKQNQGRSACVERCKYFLFMHENIPSECKPMMFENGVLAEPSKGGTKVEMSAV